MKHPGSGCGSVGRAVAFDSRGPWFDSSHRQNLIEHLFVNLFANLFIINEHLVKHCRRSMYLHHCLLTNPPNTILRNLLSLCALWHLLKVDWEGQINWLDSCVTYPPSLKCFFKWPFLDTFSLFRLLNTVDRKRMFNINFADFWIWTADLWHWKQPLYQLSPAWIVCFHYYKRSTIIH